MAETKTENRNNDENIPKLNIFLGSLKLTALMDDLTSNAISSTHDLLELNDNELNALITSIKTKNKRFSISKQNVLKSAVNKEKLKHPLKYAKPNKNVLHIVHFNDVYNIESNKYGHGGAARFATIVNDIKPLNPLILFSGDFLSPSSMSTVTNGEHMIPVLNEIGTHCAVIGNHDLDFGEEQCITVLKKLNYPTLNTNLLTGISEDITADKYNNDKTFKTRSIGDCKKYEIMNHNGFKVGLLGISEDWLDTLPISLEHGVLYLDLISECQKYVDILKNDKNCDIIIALTHARLPNDIELCKKVKNLDIVLGGHDHMYHSSFINESKTMLVKSGTDFKNVSWIICRKNSYNGDVLSDNIAANIVKRYSKNLKEKLGYFVGDNYSFMTLHYNIDQTIKEDAKMKSICDKLLKEFKKDLTQTVGYIESDLDARFKIIRKEESNASNFTADVVRRAYKTDCVIINTGAIRADTIIKKGKFTYEDILNLFPFQKPVVVLEVNGQTIIDALEVGFKGVPKLVGGFPAIAGLKVIYDPDMPPLKRIITVYIQRYKDKHVSFKDAIKSGQQVSSGFEIIKPDGKYTLATRAYLAQGGDGFTCLKNSKILVDDESGLTLGTLLRNFFWAVDSVNRLYKLKQNKNKHNSTKSDKLIKRYSHQFSIEPSNRPTGILHVNDDENKLDNDNACENKNNSDIVCSDDRYLKIKPQIEGRIICVNDAPSGTLSPKVVNYTRLPSFVEMDHLPRNNSLLKYTSTPNSPGNSSGIVSALLNGKTTPITPLNE